ncbi:MAG TPA: GTPase HflX [Candidatus Anoxymicrobiaceae bacterium]
MTAPAADDEREPCLLVAVQLPDVSEEETLDSLQELGALAQTAGADVAGSVIQKRAAYNPSTVLGKGKLDEVNSEAKSRGAGLVIFDSELTITQQDRLADALDARVIDRTALILDIFALHAHTREGTTQVELAQLSYMLPRIRGQGIELSRMAGGIGTRRGPGETKLEVDRRRIRSRMRKLERELDQMEAVRVTQRKQRARAGLPSICLVGYTNSGKSSLLNRLTSSKVLVEDQLFSTLDSTTRKAELPDGQRVVFSDTVGFIRKLPHELVAAFRSTLEVVREADLLIHVVDATRDETLIERVRAVEEVLADLESSDIPRITALNKIDSIEPNQLAYLRRSYPDAMPISAKTGDGVEALLDVAAKRISSFHTYTLHVPAGRGDVISALYRDGSVRSRDLDDDQVILVVNLPPEKLPRYSEYLGS